MSNQEESKLDKAISSFKYYWRERFDLKEQIDMERGLNEELKKSHFSESEFDFSIDFPLHFSYGLQFNKDKDLQNVDFSIPLLKQINELELKLNELQTKYSFLNGEQNQDDENSSDILIKKIETIKEEIKSIDMYVNSLLDKIVSYEDEELHELRARKQHIDLQKKMNQRSYL